MTEVRGVKMMIWVSLLWLWCDDIGCVKLELDGCQCKLKIEEFNKNKQPSNHSNTNGWMGRKGSKDLQGLPKTSSLCLSELHPPATTTCVGRSEKVYMWIWLCSGCA